MKLSIVIPVYNAEKYIRECLESVKKLDITDMECILVNDESKDKSRDICLAFAEADRRFRLVDKENGGVSSARNAGLAKASGQYIFFLDADDYLREEASDALKAALEAKEQMDFIAFTYHSLWENGETKLEAFSSEDVNRLAFADSSLNTCWGKLFKKEIIDNYQISFDQSLPVGEDYKFVAQYLEHAKKTKISQVSIINYRQHGASAMRRYTIEQRLGYTRILLDFQKELVERMIVEHKLPDTMLIEMYGYYLKVLTAMCREFADKKDIAYLMLNSVTTEVLAQVDTKTLGKLKQFEYHLLERKQAGMAACYFKLKGKL